MASREYKTISGKRDNIDLIASERLNGLAYAWMGNYNQRALLVRILRHATDKKYSRSQESKIESVKFFTRGKDWPETSDLVYHCYSSFQQLSLDNFYESINDFLNPFEHSEIVEKYWKEVDDCIELFDYKYEEHERVEFWSSKKNPRTDKDLVEALAKMLPEQRNYVSAFVTALETDMKNGHAKKWVEELIKILLTCMGSDASAFQGFVPSHYENTNTVIENVIGDLDTPITQMQYNAPYFSTHSSNASNSSSLLSLSSLNLESPGYTCTTGIAESSPGGAGVNKNTKHTTVPDYCVALPDFPGMFPLVLELKPAYQESHAIVQNIEQMLSKLFFQDVVFGIVVSPRSFQLSVIIKKETDLHFASTPCVPIIKIKNRVKKLDLKELNKMCTFIYRVLKWAGKTKCLLKTQEEKK